MDRLPLTPRSRYLILDFNGVEGIRTPTVRIKSSLCWRYTTTPIWSQHLFPSLSHDFISCVNSPGRNRTFISAVSERCPQPLNDRADVVGLCLRQGNQNVVLQLNLPKTQSPFGTVGMVRIELTVSCAQDTRTTGALHPEISIDSYGSRTRLSALKGRYPVPIDERAVWCAHSGS